MVLEEIGRLTLRDIVVDQPMGPQDVRIAVHTVGICGSDVHSFTHGKFGPFVVQAPMVLGHEASGNAGAVLGMTELVAPGGTCVRMGKPVDPVAVDIVGLQVKEATVKTVFHYANVDDRAIAVLASGKIDLKPLITGTFGFADSVAAFDRVVEARPADVKLQIVM